MSHKLLLFLLLSSHAFGQLIITGNVVDANKNPLPGVNIVAKDMAYGTLSDPTGAFRVKIDRDSVILHFTFVGYQSQRLKFTTSTSVEIILQEQDLLLSDPMHGRWNLMRRKDPLYRIKSKEGTTEVYAETTTPLSSTASGLRMVSWQVDQFTVSAVFDSLRKFIDRSHLDTSAFVKFLDSQKGKECISLPGNLVKHSGKLLNDFAVAMITSDSIVITDKENEQVKALLVKDVFWHGNNCTQCCWGGIEFIVLNKDKKEIILFAITSVIC